MPYALAEIFPLKDLEMVISPSRTVTQKVPISYS